MKCPLSGNEIKVLQLARKHSVAPLICSLIWKHCWSPSKKNIGWSTIVIENQFPASYGTVLVDSRSNSVVKESFYRGDNSINKLVDCLRWLKFCDTENQKYRDLKKVLRTKEREQLLRSSAKKFCSCKSEIESDAVIHDNHATGEVYGLAHSKCNLKARNVKFSSTTWLGMMRITS